MGERFPEIDIYTKIEEFTDEIAVESLKELNSAFQELIHNENFNLEEACWNNRETWADDMKRAKDYQPEELEKEMNTASWREKHLVITKAIKALAYSKYKSPRMDDYSMTELPIGDYYIIKEDKSYAIDMSADIDGWGYNANYYRWSTDHRLICCQIREYDGKLIPGSSVQKSLTLLYDCDEKKVLDILYLTLYVTCSKQKYGLSRTSPKSGWHVQKVAF